ncbi:MAG: prolyl aminopeptidase [Candidatus Neomarinimicrobiota bacterium]|jgi:proline iminopeptidase|nr:prolyl aminopeptidase [Candidatus Neomarinimicrobiota bacterium]GIS42773.1 MAG: proline iminopeptidase [Candidatus Neomarinimicrobiota bacterium]|tara:strand:- start:142 stop:1086 length:945 start_codon:yes stop_codon:yes gene_type:complete
MELFPNIEPFNTFSLPVSDLHTIYVEESGNKNGKPVIFLHGGPGGGVDPKYRRYFDPEKWRIIMFDQRGCGKSTPFAELEENTTWDLVSDIEKIRNHLSIDKWVVFGGSWGSTLSLAYSQTHPDSCKGLILRGIFLVRKKELDWFYQEGASNIFPDRWESFLEPIPVEKRDNLMQAYYEILTGEDHSKKIEAAKAWSTWEGSTVKLLEDENFISDFSDDKFAEAFARIECHYFMNNCWFDSDNHLIENMHKIKHIPGVIIHGRYDIVCPVIQAWDLHKAWPEADLHIIPDAGHSIFEDGIKNKILEYTDRFSNL